MTFSALFRKTSSFFIVGILLSTPLHAQAGVFTDSPIVSRGDFIRSVIQELKLPLPPGADIELPYVRLPRSMEQYIQLAYNKNALNAFGDDLRLAFPITRGEALRFLVELQNENSNQPIDFRDVPSGSMLSRAVRVTIAKGWMEPLRDEFFGVNRRLTGDTAESLIMAVLGKKEVKPQEDDTSTRTITVPIIQIRSTNTLTTIPNSKLMEAVWQIINRDYLYQDKINSDKVSYDAMDAMVKSLDDPYSRFLRPQDSKNFQTQIDGEVSGIGAQVEDRDGILTVVTPLTGSPAEAAGVKPNDKIISVDGENIKGLGLQEAVEKIRGERGTSVKLEINRDGITINVTVVRDLVQVPEIAISWQGNIAVVRLMQFGKHTESQLSGLLAEVQTKNPKGLVLDLRNNPGGLLSAANLVLSTVLPKGSDVAIIKTKDTEQVDHTKQDPVIKANVPMIVLVNEGSASASEIVAGALQDYKRARVIGTKSFGKGTVQEVLEFTDRSSLKLTIAEWLTPKGHKINGIGVIPDIEVQYNSERDQQLLRALELLRN